MVGMYTCTGQGEREKNPHSDCGPCFQNQASCLWVQPQPPEVLASNAYPKVLAWDLWKVAEGVCGKELQAGQVRILITGTIFI